MENPNAVGAAEIDVGVAREGRILIVDDSVDVRSFLDRLLRPAYEIVTSSNGLEALALLRSRRFDIVIADVSVPGVDGLSLAATIRGDATLERTRIILLSSRPGDTSAAAAIESGADDYLVKPFEANDLFTRIRVAVRAARRDDDHERDTLRRWFDRAGDPTTNEATYRSFADQVPIMLFQQDVNGAISFTNRAWYETLALPRLPSSHTADAWARIIHPDDIARTLDTVSSAISDCLPWELEYRLRPADAADDSYRWYIARGAPYFKSAGEFRGWNCSIVDIHEGRVREENERALRLEAAKNERELRSLADTIPMLVWTTDASGYIEWYNRRWYEYTGQTAEEAAGWGWQTAHHPDDFPRVMERWPASIADGRPFEMEFRLRRHDGVFHNFLTRAVPLRDDDGRIYRWYGSNVDINEQKEVSEKNRRIAETLQGVFFPGSLPDTEHFRIDAVYQAADRDALVGGDWFDAIEMPDGRYLISIGDVAGHGLDASIVAARLRHAIIDFALVRESPAEILEHVNAVLRLSYDDVYATALVAFVDRTGTLLTYASAGHVSPLFAVSRDQPARALPAHGLLLGVAEKAEIGRYECRVPPESVIVFYTDGIVEFTRNVPAVEKNLATAVAALVGNRVERPAAFLRDTVLDGAVSNDDIAILVVQFSTVAPEPPPTPAELRKHWLFHSSDARSAQAARYELMHFIRRLAEQDTDVFSAEIVIGEILANTVEHAPGMVEIDIDWGSEKPVIRVRDKGPGFDRLASSLPGVAYDESGRGMFLIETLSEKLDIVSAPGSGTELTATLPVRRRSAQR